MPSSYRNMLMQPLPPTPPYTDGSFPQGVPNYPTIASSGHSTAATDYQTLAPPSEDYAQPYSSRYSIAACQPSQYPDHNLNSLSGFNVPPMAAKGPILPPIQTRERPLSEYQHVPQKQNNTVVPPKEEKPVGGVAAHLDYTMEHMVDFVSESAQGIVNPNVSVLAPFRKYVSQVLSSTRLPSSTILYGLYYLAHRMTELSKEGRYPTGPGQIYRMLTTALLLGSKFLDDNTFQNRSWSEVSNIPVQELNTLELEWLKSIKSGLHIDFNDPQGFKLWELKWHRWQALKEISVDPLTVNPLNPNLQRQPSLSKGISPTLPYPSPYSQSAYAPTPTERGPPQWSNACYDSRYDEWSVAASASRYSPPSAPHTGPNTPDWYSRAWYGSDYKSYGNGNLPTPASAQSFQSFTQQAFYQKPYTNPYTSSNWNGHNNHCGCAYCLPQHDSFYGNFQYRSQPVAG